MAAPVPPVEVGPYWTIVNVGWGGGCFIVVRASTAYDIGDAGSRTASLALTPAGTAAGMKIFGQQNTHTPANPDLGTRASTDFVAVIKAPRKPKNFDACFLVALTGSIQVPDTTKPPNSVNYFCGETTSVAVWSPIYEVQAGGQVPQFFEDLTITNTTPAGSRVLALTLGPLADVSERDVGKGARTITGTDESIWYVDAFGNYVDTGMSCDLLPTLSGGGGGSHGQKTEGWQSIGIDVWPAQGYGAAPMSDWGSDGAGAIVPTQSKAYGGPLYTALIPQRLSGINQDFLPIYDDLPDGDYKFTLQIVDFMHLRPIKPKRFLVYPMAPGFARYSIVVTTAPPLTGWHPPQEAIPGAGATGPVLAEKLFDVGAPPPASQVFEEF